MLCEECGKKEATVQMQAISMDGEVMTKNLCMECMMRYRSRMTAKNADIPSLIGSLLGKAVAQAKAEASAVRKDVVCPSCGRKLSEVMKDGDIGCERCYETFREHIEETLIKHNGSAVFLGREPAEGRNANKGVASLTRLRGELKSAIASEEFEKAAEIRDSIRALSGRVAGA